MHFGWFFFSNLKKMARVRRPVWEKVALGKNDECVSLRVEGLFSPLGGRKYLSVGSFAPLLLENPIAFSKCKP